MPSPFLDISVHLDDHNDRRERLIKASRDITNLSKKIIFLLHRLVTDADPDERDLFPAVAQKAQPQLHCIQELYTRLAPELAGARFWRYHRQVSPGLQEYIEALSFSHYLAYGTLIPFSAVQDTLRTTDGSICFPLQLSDYLLGVSDLTGELMRFAISGLSRRGGRAHAASVSTFVRALKADLERFAPHVHDLDKKQTVTTQSLEKIEDAAYAVAVRSSEYALPPEVLDDIVVQSVSRFEREIDTHVKTSRI